MMMAGAHSALCLSGPAPPAVLTSSSSSSSPLPPPHRVTSPLAQQRPALRAAAKAGAALLKDGNFGEKPRSSVSALIDILCLDKYEEDDLDGIAELVESINLQPMTGCVVFPSLYLLLGRVVHRRDQFADLARLLDVGDLLVCSQPD